LPTFVLWKKNSTSQAIAYLYVAELKLWRSQQAHESGLDQLADYLDRLGLDEGYLLIFDPRVNKEWKSEEMMHQGKRIFSVWV
jgi:hypothetical protein